MCRSSFFPREGQEAWRASSMCSALGCRWGPASSREVLPSRGCLLVSASGAQSCADSGTEALGRLTRLSGPCMVGRDLRDRFSITNLAPLLPARILGERRPRKGEVVHSGRLRRRVHVGLVSPDQPCRTVCVSSMC